MDLAAACLLPAAKRASPRSCAGWDGWNARCSPSTGWGMRNCAVRPAGNNGQVVPINPAHTVRGPRHVVTSGQTPVLDPAEARALLDSIDTGSTWAFAIAP